MNTMVSFLWLRVCLLWFKQTSQNQVVFQALGYSLVFRNVASSNQYIQYLSSFF